eukprot:TRINITY_DN4298_c0_g2_i1.p1 TRINITY_DN4298_c0_g2~~TRINITY_DN4298_c0_g2_i1.p1  ORF type:complete len:1103 (-),score=124.19 TRINITY_DN4298_c0_g2_i1:141-3449(-)
MWLQQFGRTLFATVQRGCIVDRLAYRLVLVTCVVFTALAENLEGRLCVVVERPPPGAAEQVVQVIWRTWAVRNATFLVQPDRVPEWRPRGLEVSRGLKTWRFLSDWLPGWCGWVLKVSTGVYVNIANFEERLRCLDAHHAVAYLGTPLMMALDDGQVMRVADSNAGVVMRRGLLNALPNLLDLCVAKRDFESVLKYDDIGLGSCLWARGIELHSLVDPGDEVFYTSGSHVFASPDQNSKTAPFDRIMASRATATSLGTLQCVFLITSLNVVQMVHVHRMVGKSQRWFKNIACAPSGFIYPEFTTARSYVNGEALNEPILSPVVRSALQSCFLGKAFSSLGSSEEFARGRDASTVVSSERTREADTTIASPAALFEEWRNPQIALGPSVSRLQRGGHSICIFVTSTVATEQHTLDTAAVLRSWGARGLGVPEDVQVFLVGRHVNGPDDAVLRLRGDVDMGFIFNTVRMMHIWRYLALHHSNDCKWFVKTDADTYVNPWALRERLSRYFDWKKSVYLGTLKVTKLGSGRELPFAYNLQVLSTTLLKEATRWFEICLKDLVKRKLGKGAEDIDLAYCLDLHGAVRPSRLGSQQEVSSRAMLRASKSQEGNTSERLLVESGACTLFVHPVHGEEMLTLHAEVLSLRDAELSKSPDSPASVLPCDWLADKPNDPSRWQRYMDDTYRGSSDCWLGEFTWKSCCDVRVFGPLGNPHCWDEEHTFGRCCRQGQGRQAAAAVEALQAVLGESPPDPRPEPRPLAPSAPVPPEQVGTAVADTIAKEYKITPLFSDETVRGRGNPKCWAHKDKQGEFTFEMCCTQAPWKVPECWAWPYTPGFCCTDPLPPRPPIQVGGLQSPTKAASDSSRTSRCPEDLGGKYLACKMSLDEIGKLFELSVIGTGDKASGFHDYLGVYERALLHLPLSANVLEIGVRLGSSMAMWAEYFPFGKVVGIDKSLQTFRENGQLLVQHGALKHGNVFLVEGNGTDPSILPLLWNKNVSNGFADVVVDDANHWAKDQIARFEIFFPTMLRRGGVYIVEDVHIQAPYAHDGNAVRDYFVNLSRAAYLVEDEILIGSHHIASVRDQSKDWRHMVESVTLFRDVVMITKAA